MRTLKLTIAYDGTDFNGWQSQPQGRTVQQEFEVALSRVTGEAIRVVGSGRTDAGVHALGQVVSFETASLHDNNTFKRALNAELPDDIVVLSVEDAPPGFHAIRAATHKRYRYAIHFGRTRDVFQLRYAWQVPYQLDIERMSRAGGLLLGKHDFSSFEGSKSVTLSSVRTIYAIDTTRPSLDRPCDIHIEVEADGFLYNMVRAIVGTLVAVGRGKQNEAWVRHVLEARDRSAAGITAPAAGLYLLWVKYDER